MTLMSLRCLLAAFLLAFVPLLGATAEPSIVSKARAHIGPEAILNSVRSIQYRGMITTDEGKKVSIEIIFQKPFQHRVTASGTETIEVTALDDLEGWQRVQDSKDPTRWKMSLLVGDQIRRLRANVMENLGFFRIDGVGDGFRDEGLVDFEGRKAHKLVYTHSPSISFIRYIDPETGRLLLTETERGGTIREEGEIVAGGLRFPKKMITISRMGDGSQRSVVIEFESISVNETFASSLFAVPMMSAR